MNEGAALRVLSFLSDASERHVASLVNEKHKVTVIGEEHEPDELVKNECSLNSIDNEPPPLTTEELKEFFKAIEDGSIERLDELFDSVANADPDMTWYAESLLMTAIRCNRQKIAEYLIDQLATNVNYTLGIREFRTHTTVPIRERLLTCRELAYERGMMDLVDLIDIASDQVKPNVKRYLQRRLKVRLTEIHQSYLKRMKERSNRLLIQTQDKNNHIIEEDEYEKRRELLPNINLSAVMNLGSSTGATRQEMPPPSTVRRTYKSHIAETIKKIESSNDKSIDETGKKVFRFSAYKVRYQLNETGKSNKNGSGKQFRPKTTSLNALQTAPPFTNTDSQSFSNPVSRPTTTKVNVNQDPHSNTTSQIPIIKETRTSISRSARNIATPRMSSSVNVDTKFETKPTTTRINSTQRLLPKRISTVHTVSKYIPSTQYVPYKQPHCFMPVTLKTTAIGLPYSTRLIRE